MDVPSIPMDVDTTMPIGLIVNELVSNAFKYAFHDIDKPILSLEIIEHSNRKFSLFIKDNGKGFPSDFDFDQAKSFGLKLVRLLTRQLKAELKIDQSNGLLYSFSFSTN